jgi:hypothetical protein
MTQRADTSATDVRPEASLLGVYLNDHLAGATFGAELASRIARGHRHLDGEALERFVQEVVEDRASLLEMMAALDVPVRRYKMLLGWVAEKTGRFKPNGRLLERSPLSSLLEFEMMRLGVEGKASGWRTLRMLAERDDRLDPARLDELLARAERQTEMLEEFRVREVAELTGAR